MRTFPISRHWRRAGGQAREAPQRRKSRARTACTERAHHLPRAMARLISTSSVRSLFAKNHSLAFRRTGSSPPAARTRGHISSGGAAVPPPRAGGRTIVRTQSRAPTWVVPADDQHALVQVSNHGMHSGVRVPLYGNCTQLTQNCFRSETCSGTAWCSCAKCPQVGN